MSIEEKEKNTKIEDKGEDGELSLIDQSVALVIAERDEAIRKLDTACDEIEALRKKLADAEAIIEEDLKAGIVNDISPKTTVTKKALSAMSLDDLMKWKKVLDVALQPVFKSGTPLSFGAKPSARQKLDSVFAEEQAIRKGGNR